MFRIRKIWWTVTVLLISLYIPSKGHAIITIHTARYKNTTLLGKVTFQYSKSTSKNRGGGGTESSNFSQNYSLNMYGSLLNPLLMVYKAGIKYAKQNRDINSSKSEKDRYAYNFKTYILAESKVPLTLYGQRTVSEGSKEDSYGLNWRGKFETLPKTDFDVNRSVTEVWRNTNYRLSLRKDLTNSKNKFDYSLSDVEARLDSTKSSTTAMNFSNQTTISRSTGFNLNAAKGISEAADGEKSHVEGMNVNIHSNPGWRFSQSHLYYFNNTEEEDRKETGEGYSGGMSYRFSDNLSSSMALSVSNNDVDSLTAKREVDSLNTSGSLNYQASKKLSLSESISYSTVELLGSAAGQTNMTDRSNLRVRSRASYNTALSWARMSTSYGLAYVEETRTGKISTGQKDRGTAINQRFNLALRGMDAKSYATVNASAGYGYSEPLKGDYNNSTFNFSTSATNKIWREDIDLSASYIKNIHKSSWISASEEESDRFLFRGRTPYLAKYLNPDGNGRTSLDFRVSRASNSNNFDPKRTNSAQQIGMRHNRIMYRGMLTGSVGYGGSQSSSSGNKTSSKHIDAIANYERMLLRRIVWKAESVNSWEKTDSHSRYRSSIANKFRYRLRVWSLSAEHEFRWRKQSRSRSISNRIMFTASRSFVRVF